MGFAFRAMIWIIAFNLAVGIVVYAFGANSWLVSPEGMAQQGLDSTGTLYNTYGQGQGVPVEESSFWYRFLDVISLGFYNKIKLFLDSTIFSIPTLFTKLHIMPEGITPYVNGIIVLIFVIGMFEIFTGKDLTLR